MQIPQTRFCNIFASRPRDAGAGGCVEAELGQGQPRPHCVWRLGLVCLRLEARGRAPHRPLHGVKVAIYPECELVISRPRTRRDWAPTHLKEIADDSYS